MKYVFIVDNEAYLFDAENQLKALKELTILLHNMNRAYCFHDIKSYPIKN